MTYFYVALLPDQGPLKVPTGCLLSGLNLMTSQCLRQLDMAGDIIIQGHYIELGELKLKVFTVMGAQDELEVAFNNAVTERVAAVAMAMKLRD